MHHQGFHRGDSPDFWEEVWSDGEMEEALRFSEIDRARGPGWTFYQVGEDGELRSLPDTWPRCGNILAVPRSRQDRLCLNGR